MQTRTLARIVSIVGHPALLMPLAVAGSAVVRDAPPSVVRTALLASALVAVAVGLYSLRQVRTGRWRHVDASVPGERRQLNRFLLVLLPVIAALLLWAGQPPLLSAGLAMGAAMVLVALMCRHWLKLSLHAAFGLFAAGLAWPSTGMVLVLALLALAVGWSRLALGRHTRAEVLAGLALGGSSALLWLGVERMLLPGLVAMAGR